MKSVFHNNPNPFTGNAPGMGFKVISMGGRGESVGRPMDRVSMLESRIAELERMLGMGSESDMGDDFVGSGEDKFTEMLFGLV